MRHFLLIILLYFLSRGNAQDIVVVQINAKWNAKNTMEELRELDNCEYVFGWLENQPYHIQSSVSSVPLVVVYKDNIPKQQYTADITLRLSATFEEIQTLVNSLKEQ